ncbi:MAG TPA: LpqB family beta-propeller domain-containing protein [Candidatus Acidoferrales bacterium]|nr:LpqB family beta-propeller domain-containing protein [Candidatus Acidoferrales bacterium]
MTLKTGTRIGPYEINTPLGAGGMGEVYRARDTKLGREVALKVLPEGFARDAERVARLRREAQTLASLNHPNIAAIYGFEDSGATHALVMELVEGPTLAERIKQGAIPLDEALQIAKQIAEGVEYAHERGIVHRDLKPGNIKITNSDAVKILDFGLAKAVEGEPGSVDISSSPTISRMATQAGVILGTAAYMSPEQAKGKAVDRRTDIWAFGCVLYEMLTGKMLFSGETVTDTLAAILKSEPDWTQLPSATPAHIRVLLRRCLQKDPRQRLRDIGDARVSLEEVLAGSPESYSSEGVAFPLVRRSVPWAVAGLIVGGLIAGLAVWKFAPGFGPRTHMHFRAVTNFSGVQAQPAFSPDGHSVAFVSNRDGHYNVYVGLTGGGRLVQVTNDANLKSRPAWSPDGATLAYARLNDSGLWDIWEVPALGGTPRPVILDATDPAWSPDGHSLAYENGTDHTLWISGAQGENAHRVLPAPAPDSLLRYTEPRFSPDGSQIAFISRVQGPGGEVRVVDTASGKVHELTHDDVLALSPAWSPDGRSIYSASGRAGTVNIWKDSLRGGAGEQITAGQGEDAQLDVSSDGKSIVFSTWRTNTNIARLDLSAKGPQQKVEMLTTDPARNQVAPAYSHDGKRIAYFSNLNGVENESIWISDADGSNPLPLVRDDQINVFPHWGPGDNRIAYKSFTKNPAGFLETSEYRDVPVSGGAPKTVYNNSAGDNFEIGADGRFLFVNSKNEAEIFTPAANKTEVIGPIPVSPRDTPLRFSADEHSVAYIVDASRDQDPNAGLWVTDFKNPPRQIFRGWVVWFARGPKNRLYLLEGEPDLNGVLQSVDWDGRNLERTSVLLPMTYSYWTDPSEDPQVFFDISPDGRYIAFMKQTVLSANVGMVTRMEGMQ